MTRPLLSCASKPLPQLHDIYVLKTLAGEPVTTTIGQQPTLEINLTRNEIMGHDGCNEFSAPIHKATATNISFGQLQRTRMACPDRELQANYVSSLAQTKGYRREQLKLYLLDDTGAELMTFLKVD